MSVVLFFGKTKSGKSYKAGQLSLKRKKVIIYDNAHCFNDGQIINDFSAANFAKVFKENVNKESFRLIFRPPLNMPEKDGAELVARLLYYGFGRYWKENNFKINENIFFLVDEADKVSSLKVGSIFYLVVTKGRHFFIDTYAISQGPGKLPLYYRENAEEFYCFKSKSHSYLDECLEREQVDILRTIEKWHCIHWKDTGEVKLLNEKNKAVKSWN